MPPLVSIRDLTVVRSADAGMPEALVLEGVSLEIEPGEVVGIVGETGSGRSTLVRTLNGIVPHLVRREMHGTVEVAGRDPRVVGVADMAAVVAVVLDDPEAQVTQLTVADEVAFGLENLGVAPGEILGRVADALEQVGLAGFDDRNPLTLSGGEQQRLVIAAALAMRPRVLVMDEPTANLDAAAARAVMDLVRTLADAQGAVVIVSDDVDLLAEHVDRVIWLHDGRVRLDAAPGVVFAAIAREPSSSLAPVVTELAARIDPVDHDLPVTAASAVSWLAGRRS